MFKKSFEVRGHQRLSGADRKKLKRAICEKSGFISEDIIDVLLPPKADLTVTKLFNKALVYGGEDGIPMFFDADGRGKDIFPTVYALWNFPNLLPSFLLKGGEVSKFVIGGADLMLPGIQFSENFKPFQEGELWSVVVPGNKYPIAVGVTLTSSTAAIKSGMRGKALRIMHYYHDLLWESYSKHYAPNAGFLEDWVTEDHDYSNDEQQNAESIESTEVTGLTGLTELTEKQLEVGIEFDAHNLHSSSLESSALPESMDRNLQQQDTEQFSVKSNDDLHGMKDEEEDEAVKNVVSPETMDFLLEQSLLQALHTSLEDKLLPILGSALWSIHILHSKPEGFVLDVKKSSFKKLSKWLQAMASLKLLTVKEDKHTKESMVTSINRKHPKYIEYRPKKMKSEPKPESKAEATETNSKPIKVSELFKTSHHTSKITEAVGSDSSQLFDSSQVRDLIFSYVDKENLTSPNDPSIIILNPPLCDALFKGAIKKGSSFPTTVKKSELASLFTARMASFHSVSRGEKSAVKKGVMASVVISSEQRQGRKKVTKINGVENFLIEAVGLATDLQKKFACSTSLNEVPGKKGVHEVLVQGDVVMEVGNYLVQNYDIPKKFILVKDTKKH